MSETGREMTLEEWVGRLHVGHRARREYEAMKATPPRRELPPRAVVFEAVRTADEWKVTAATDAVLAALGEWAGGEGRKRSEYQEALAREYTFRLDDAIEYRCHDCLHRADTGHECKLLDIHIADPTASRCPAWTPDEQGDEGGGFRVSREALCNCFLVPDSPLTARFVERITEVIRAHGGEVVEGGGGE